MINTYIKQIKILQTISTVLAWYARTNQVYFLTTRLHKFCIVQSTFAMATTWETVASDLDDRDHVNGHLSVREQERWFELKKLSKWHYCFYRFYSWFKIYYWYSVIPFKSIEAVLTWLGKLQIWRLSKLRILL